MIHAEERVSITRPKNHHVAGDGGELDNRLDRYDPVYHGFIRSACRTGPPGAPQRLLRTLPWVPENAG